MKILLALVGLTASRKIDIKFTLDSDSGLRRYRIRNAPSDGFYTFAADDKSHEEQSTVSPLEDEAMHVSEDADNDVMDVDDSRSDVNSSDANSSDVNDDVGGSSETVLVSFDDDKNITEGVEIEHKEGYDRIDTDFKISEFEFISDMIGHTVQDGFNRDKWMMKVNIIQSMASFKKFISYGLEDDVDMLESIDFDEFYDFLDTAEYLRISGVVRERILKNILVKGLNGKDSALIMTNLSNNLTEFVAPETIVFLFGQYLSLVDCEPRIRNEMVSICTANDSLYEKYGDVLDLKATQPAIKNLALIHAVNSYDDTLFSKAFHFTALATFIHLLGVEFLIVNYDEHMDNNNFNLMATAISNVRNSLFEDIRDFKIRMLDIPKLYTMDKDEVQVLISSISSTLEELRVYVTSELVGWEKIGETFKTCTKLKSLCFNPVSYMPYRFDDKYANDAYYSKVWESLTSTERPYPPSPKNGLDRILESLPTTLIDLRIEGFAATESMLNQLSRFTNLETLGLHINSEKETRVSVVTVLKSLPNYSGLKEIVLNIDEVLTDDFVEVLGEVECIEVFKLYGASQKCAVISSLLTKIMSVSELVLRVDVINGNFVSNLSSLAQLKSLHLTSHGNHDSRYVSTLLETLSEPGKISELKLELASTLDTNVRKAFGRFTNLTSLALLPLSTYSVTSDIVGDLFAHLVNPSKIKQLVLKAKVFDQKMADALQAYVKPNLLMIVGSLGSTNFLA